MRNLNLRLLQVAVSLAAVQAFAGGGYYLWMGVEGLNAFSDLPLEIEGTTLSRVDFMFRALAGIWFALGGILAYMVPSVEKHSVLFVLAYIAIFMMGIGRYLSLSAYGDADGNSQGAMIAELLLPIVLIVWQRLTARSFAKDDADA